MLPKPKSYLALGDSYTIGEKVPPNQRWSNQLVNLLSSAGILVSNHTIIAKTGWTTADLLHTLENTNLPDTHDLATLLIGVNNQYQNLSLESYRVEFNQLLQQTIHYAGDNPEHVIVLSIPDWSVTPFAAEYNRVNTQMDLEKFNMVNYKITKKTGANYIDITPISHQASSDPSLLAEDKLHPSGKMYSLWTGLIFPTAYKILQNDQT